jgi:uncharacterized membrane protein (UPF0127 family)
MFEALLSGLLAVVGGGAGAGSAGGQKPAALACANPQLPQAILAGANGAVSGDVEATPLRTVSVTGSAVALTLAVAADERSRERGLMCVTALRPAAGMIFVFPSANEWQFWMKNTVAPLDMVWLADDGTVTHVAANVPASTLETPNERVARRSGHGRFVIELRAGEAAAEHIAAGTRLTVPALAATE